MDLSALLWGNGYAYIDRDGGRVLGLYNLLPDRTTPYRRNGELWYMTEVGGKMEAIPDYHIYHIEGLCLEGWQEPTWSGFSVKTSGLRWLVDDSQQSSSRTT